MRREATVFLCAALAFPLYAQTDTLSTATVRAWRIPALVSESSTGELRLEAESLRSLPNTFGTADPLRYVSFLPGVQTGSEMDLGIHVMGGEASQTLVCIGDAPIYGAKHLLGLFSVFNTEHFSSLDYDPSGNGTSRLGGKIGLSLPEAPAQVLKGYALVSPLLAGGNLAVPLSKRSSLSLGLRRSLLTPSIGRNLDLDYSFVDLNLSFTDSISSKDLLQASLYSGRDDGTLTSGDFFSDVSASWGNLTSSLSWTHAFSSKATLCQTLYLSRFALDGKLLQSSFSLSLPSDVATLGYKAELLLARGFRLSTEAQFHSLHPQAPSLEGSLGEGSSPLSQKGLELSLDASYPLSFGEKFSLTPGLRLPSLVRSGYSYIFADPYLEAVLEASRSLRLSARTGVKHQFLSQTGFANTAMPLEFYLLPGEYTIPQGSVYATLSGALSLGEWQVCSSLYLRRLSGQIEYLATPVGLLSGDWDLSENILVGEGLNYGANLSLIRLKGRLSGWASYSFGRSLRHFEGLSESFWVPSSAERIHEFNAVLSYRRGSWEIGGSLVIASGTPYTPAQYLYYASGRVMAVYGEFNSARLPAYVRLDGSLGWNCFTTPFCRGWLNLSLYNALNCPNYYSRSIHIEQEGISYRFNRSFLRLVPSIGFRVEL